MDWHEQPVGDAAVLDSFGPDALPAFRYAQARLEGRVRKVTLEPAFCHSADVALRAADLGFPPAVVKAALLHDVIEDTSKTVAQLAQHTDEVRADFDPVVAAAAELLTNRHQVIFKALRGKLKPKLPFDQRSAKAYRAALEVLRWELPAELAQRYAPEIDRLARFLEDEADVTTGAYIVKRDKKFRLSTWLERQVYRVYVADLAQQAAAQVEQALEAPAVVALIVKLFDTTDNIRTSEISNRLALYKLMNKVEGLLDTAAATIGAERPADASPAWRRTQIPTLVRLLQLRLVDQVEARRRAVGQHFAETRFGGLVGFLGAQAERLAKKYAVPADRVGDIQALQDVVRAANRRTT